jgi:hypothetical protein
MSLTQRFFHFILPKKWFEKIKEESQQWHFECDCGYKKSVWEAGGIRYLAAKDKNDPGKSRKSVLWRCPQCNKSKWRQLTYHP